MNSILCELMNFFASHADFIIGVIINIVIIYVFNKLTDSFTTKFEKRLRDKKTRVIDETTPLLVIAGPMFVELLLNIFLIDHLKMESIR